MSEVASPQIIQVPANFEPRDYQLALFQAMDGTEGDPTTKCRRALLRWHRRAGKDKACFAYMAKEMVQRPGIYYYFFPTYQQGRKALWESLDKDGFRVLDHLPKCFVKRKLDQEMLIELTNGSIFRIIGTDEVDKSVVGTNPIGCVFSEYSLQNPRGWTFISPILAENGGWAIFNGTPRGRNHMYKMENMALSKKNWYVSGLTVTDSGLEDRLAEQINEDRELHGDDFVDQEYYVCYSAGVRGAIYMSWIEKARVQGRIGCFPVRENVPVDTFWDIGFGDSCCIWFRQMVGDRITWVDYYENTQQTYQFYVDILKNKGYNYRTHYLPHDAANHAWGNKSTPTANMRELCEANKLGFVVDTKKFIKKTDAIQAVRSRMSRMCWNEGTCWEGLEKISMYHFRWDSKRAVFLEEPIHDWSSHAADALSTEASAEEFDDIDNPFHQSFEIISEYNPLD